ncbi:unnamed protein product, partial [Durusdinium trenchii]
MADTLFDFELLDSADDFMDLDLDPMEQEVAAAESAQLEADQDEMAIYDLAKDLEAMVSGVNTLSLQATTGCIPTDSGTHRRPLHWHLRTLLQRRPWHLPAACSRKRPLDQSDKAGALAGASGPDTGMPWLGVVILEPRQDAPLSSVQASGALSLCGGQPAPAPSSTLRTTLETQVPVEGRLQDPVTYSFAEDGNILLTNVMAGLPCLPKKLAQPLRSIQVGEIIELCLQFDVTKLTPAAFARIVEVYAIAKAKHLAQEIWEAKHLPKGARSMEKLTTLPEVESKLPYTCANCFASWVLPKSPKCLHCGSTEGKVPTALPSASVTVDGVTWTMTFDADSSSVGSPTPGTREVMQRGDDEVFRKEEVERKPQRATDDDPGQETITFHPSNVKAKEENQAFHQKQKRKLEPLLPTYDGISVWPDKVRKALESGLFEPERGPMAVDGEQLQEVKEAYLRAREFIKQGTNLFNPRLLEEIPDCLLNTTFMEYQEEPSTGASRPDMGGSSASGPTSIDPLTKEIVTELEPG